MKSNHLISDNICIFTINPVDKQKDDIGIEFLDFVKKSFIHNVIFDLSLFEIISSEDIEFIEKLVKILKLNNVEVIVCNFNVYSASIIFHFIDHISFNTTLDVQKAIDAFKNNKK